MIIGIVSENLRVSKHIETLQITNFTLNKITQNYNIIRARI